MEPVDPDILKGYTHDASALEVEGDIDSLAIQASELGDGIADGGEEAK
jgi:hypothetical protein